MKFSWTLGLSGVFIAYVLHSIYSIVSIYIPPSCSDTHCLKSYLSSQPKMQLIIGTTHKTSLRSWKELTLIDKISPFDYNAGIFTKNLSIPLPKSTRQNGTLSIYAFATPMPRTAKESEEWDQSIRSSNTMSAYFQLTQYLVPEAETFNLLNSNKEKKDDETVTKEKAKKGKGQEKTVAHIAKKLRLTMLTDQLVLPVKDLPVDFGMLIRLISSDTYLPPLRFDRFNSRLRDFYKVNAFDETYELEFEFSSASIGSMRMAAQFQAAMETMETSIGFTAKDLDEIKGIFADTNVYLLALTMFVASIHLLFDFLAFKNDVIYWKRRRTTAGLSSRTIFWRCFSQMVVFLYLLEEKSSMLVIVPSGIGAVIEIWKVTKTLKITMVFEGGLPRIRFGQFSESEKATAQHDVESMKYLSYLLYPLCICGAIYSLLYTPHKSWYSWTVQSMVNGVYAFGFLFMLPQLFINYRLKSVAHLPWRAFMYKAFNTFIDDIFAFIITMPTAHRVACFRDDIVFLIYLYQRWLYPVDKTRIDAGGDVEYDVDADESKALDSSNGKLLTTPKPGDKKND